MFNFLNQGILGFFLFLNKFFQDFGLTVIFFTLILKTVLLPIDFLVFLEEEKIKKIKPKVDEILRKYKNDIKKQMEIIGEIYLKEKYNPLKTLILQLITFPLIFSIFFVLSNLVKIKESIYFLGIINLKEKNIFLFLIVVLVQILMILNLPHDQRKASFIIFGFVIIVLAQFPSLFNLYWLSNILLTLLERELFRIYYVKVKSEFVPKNNT